MSGKKYSLRRREIKRQWLNRFSAWKAFPGKEAKESIQDKLVCTLKRVLNYSDNSEIDLDKNFFEMGMDSMMALEFQYDEDLNAIFSDKVNMNIQTLYEYPGVTNLLTIFMTR